MKVYTNEIGHMTSMAAIPIYGKKPVKMFFSKIDGRILLKLDKNKRLYIKRQKNCLQLIVTFRHFNKLRRFCRLRHFTMLRCFRLTDFAKLQRLAF